MANKRRLRKLQGQFPVDKAWFFSYDFCLRILLTAVWACLHCRCSSKVEQLICNQQVGGSIPLIGSSCVPGKQFSMYYLYLVSLGEVPERSKGADCKSVGSAFGGSNPPLPTAYGTVIRGGNSSVG